MDKAGPIEDLIKKLNKLPGIGSKTAQRLAYHIIDMEDIDVKELAKSIVRAKTDIVQCSECMNFSDKDPCDICQNKTRDDSVICVVEYPKDVEAMERSMSFNGKYHVLHGVISPMKGYTADDVKVRELLRRLEDGKVKEVIIATNPTTDGDTTAMYLKNLLEPYNVEVTRIGYGLPVGGDLEFYDELTISTAMKNRRKLN
ncbi:recombination protein RecR [Peptoniphilus olsenii]|uniref:Recombination protein RecR n=1 Tax=Peptoniphilus olsenii TaxID=411570 RepID=A0ABV2J977_9FIRM